MSRVETFSKMNNYLYGSLSILPTLLFFLSIQQPYSEACNLNLFVDESFIVNTLNYSENVWCQWNITVPEGYKIGVEFPKQWVQQLENGCGGNYVKVYDGHFPNGAFARNLCGFDDHVAEQTFAAYSKTNKMSVVFKSSDADKLNNGFSAMVVKEACNVDIFVDEPHIQNTTDFPDNYSRESVCHWNIRAPEGYAVRVKFLSFVKGNAHCENGVVNIYDGDNSNYKPIGAICDTPNQPPADVYSSSNRMLIMLKSESRTEYFGLSVLITKVKIRSIDGSPSTVETISGNTAKMTFRTKALLQPSIIKWMQQGTKLDGEQYSIEINGDLTISPVSPNDSGIKME